jgi:hypothetical protein
MIPTVENPAMELDPIALLIPQGIENFAPRCVVCTKPVPAKRATSRSKDTCGPACHKVLRMYRQHVLRSSKCPACYHPSTPEERKEFQAWRKMRGDRRHSVGRPKQTDEDRLKKMLKRTIDFVVSLPIESPTIENELDDILLEANKLIDNQGNSVSTLEGERAEPDQQGDKPDAK